MEELEKLQKEHKALSDLFKKIERESKMNFDKVCQIESDNRKLNGEILSLKIENIAELKASKILFKMVKCGYTHRQKNEIADHANIVLNTDIKEKINALKDLISDLPF